MAVLDASVFLAAALPGDPHHETCRAWLEDLIQSGRQFNAPAVFLSEVAAPISRGHQRPQHARRLVETVRNAPWANLVPVDLPLAGRAAEIAADYGIRGCDSLYVALAELLDEELVTLDGQQQERGAAVIRTFVPG